MVFPQGVKSIEGIINPRGCWDWWGFCDFDPENFATNQGIQPKAIMGIVDDLQNGKLELTHASEEVMDYIQCRNTPFYDTKIIYPKFPSDF